MDAGVHPFRKAVAAGVDFLVVHHGMYWDMPRPLTGPAYARVEALMGGNCALYSSHLPLDSHPKIGNNALLAAELGLRPRRGFVRNEGGDIGCIAPSRLARTAIKARLKALYTRVIAIEYGSASPRQVAFCSGGGNAGRLSP